VGDVTPEKLAVVTPWSRGAWQLVYDLVATDDRLDWDDLVCWALSAGEGPRMIYAIVVAMEPRPIPEMTDHPGGAA
jgi:hypothetical protein